MLKNFFDDRKFVDETDDTHFARALGADKRICFVHLSDELRPALERLTPGFMGAFGAERTLRPLQAVVRHRRRLRR